MTYFLSILFFLAGIIGVCNGYSGPNFNLFFPPRPLLFNAGITFIAAGGIIWALADMKSTIEQQKKK